MGGESEPRPTHLWRDSALVALALTAVVFTLGYLRTKSYFGALGLGWNSVQFAPHEYMGSAWSLYLTPLLALMAFGLIDKLLPVPEPTGRIYLQAISAPMFVLQVAGWTALVTWANMGDETWVVWHGTTIADLSIYAFGGTFSAFMLYANVRRQRGGESLFGRTPAAQIYQVGAAIGLMLLAAVAHGSDAANDLRWGCVAHESVAFEPLPPGLESNATYWLLLQHDDFFFVRDASLHGSKVGYIAVHESSVEIAHVTREPARSCPNA